MNKLIVIVGNECKDYKKCVQYGKAYLVNICNFIIINHRAS